MTMITKIVAATALTATAASVGADMPARAAPQASVASDKGADSLKCLRIYATPDGESHFGEVDIPMTATLTVAPGAKPFQLSKSYPASSLAITRIPAGMRPAWHTVPERALTVRLTGAIDYETSDGAVRHVSAGEFVLMEDTQGKGHLSRYSTDAQTVLWIRLPAGLD